MGKLLFIALLFYVTNLTQSDDMGEDDYTQEPQHYSWDLGEPDNLVKTEVILKTNQEPDEFDQY